MALPGELLLIARLPALVVQALLAGMAPLRLEDRLGNALFAPSNWHQSLSLIYPAAMRGALLDACSEIRAAAFAMHLDCVLSDGDVPGRIHWRIIPSGGKPRGLINLLHARQVAFAAHGITDTVGHSAHTTVSYRANETLGKHAIPLVTWIVDMIELVVVRGSGQNYRYETVERWPLDPMPSPPILQPSLLP